MAKKAPYDPVLSSLFESSLGPVQSALRTPARTFATARHSPAGRKPEFLRESNPRLDATPNREVDQADSEDVSDSDLPLRSIIADGGTNERSRKRKRRDADDNIEGAYMRNLAQEEAKEDAKRRIQYHTGMLDLVSPNGDEVVVKDGVGSEADELETGDEEKGSSLDVPRHETLTASKTEPEVEKASRTVFLANVSTATIKSKSAKRLLIEHLSSFLPSLPKQQTAHKVESLRFRSTAFTSSAAPKKAAFAKKDLMDSTTKSTNAYAVYTTQLATREAAKRLNGTVVLDRHLRVDSVAHPAKQDHRRCVFVGNLGFVDDENSINAAEDDVNIKRPRKAKEAADVEEGLWRQFSKAGTVESVRVVRDKTTRVGKGFAYVQFVDPNGVEKALLYNEKKFPPLLPRILRVTRAKNASKTDARQKAERRPNKKPMRPPNLSGYQPKAGSKIQTLSGRAGKLLGRAGAAHLRVDRGQGNKAVGVRKSPETVVFEGHRASSKQGKGTLKLGGTGKKKQGKPQNRSSKRGAAFKAKGSKEGKS